MAGRGGVALVSGEAGIGKSSLVRAFVAAGAAACAGRRVTRPRIVRDELRRHGPTICIVEDAHWADEATIDVLTFVARRVVAIPAALLVVSFRDDEVGPDHPLRRAPAATPAGCTHRLELER